MASNSSNKTGKTTSANVNVAKEKDETVAAAAAAAARLPLPSKSQPKSDTSMPRLEEDEIEWKIPEKEDAAELNPWSLAALEANQGQAAAAEPLTPLRSSTLSSATMESSTIAVKTTTEINNANTNNSSNSNRKIGSGGGLFQWFSRSSQTPTESSNSTTTTGTTPLSFYNRYTPHTDTNNDDDNDDYFNSFISTPQSTIAPTSLSTTTQPHWTRDYNAIEACERAEAFRVRLYEWIQWCMAMCVDAVAAVLLVLYGVALVIERMATNKRSTVSTVVLSLSFALSALYGLRAFLIVYLLKRQKLQRSSGYSNSSNGSGSLCVWTLATIILSLVLALLYMVATIVMMDDSLSFHHHASPHNETNPNDHNSTLPPNNATLLVDNSLAWSQQSHAHAVIELLSVQDSSHYHWLGTLLQRHAHELLIPVSWLDYDLQHCQWEDLMWVVFLCLALWEVFARAWFSYTTRHYHYPHVNLETSTAGRTGNIANSSAWHEDDDFNYTHGGQGRSSGSLMMRLFPRESSSLNDGPLLDHRANPQTRSKGWFGFGNQRSKPTSAYNRHDDEDSHLFAALNEDWADRARDDPLWWSRD